MARPRKNTVEYFPHFCKSGKTISIIEKKFKNDGYACWFKILEILGDSDCHFYDCSDEYNWEYLKAKTLIDDDEVLAEIIDLLATIKAVDKKLWVESRVLWSDNFLSGLAGVYQKRTTEMPVKPCFRVEKPPVGCISGEKTPQRKGKESIGEESKGENTIPYGEIVDFLNQKTGKHFRATSKKTISVIKARLAEGFTKEDFFKVIENKSAKWKSDPKMVDFLRPETLFGNKFEGYLNEKPADTLLLSANGQATAQAAQEWINESR